LFPPVLTFAERYWVTSREHRRAAASLAKQEGLYRAARTLHLDYASLKKRVEKSWPSGFGGQRTEESKKTGTSKRAPIPANPGPVRRSGQQLSNRQLTAQTATRTTSPAEFVELLADSIAADCLIEVEEAGGARLRIQMRMTAPEVLTLVRDWRSR
jgi:hypothetical protein